MIITQTPLRLSLFGGGTDFKEYYKKEQGAVLGFTINKYVYVLVNNRFESSVRASYSKTENVSNTLELKHELIKESLLDSGINNGIEVVTVADVPGSGTGLGSSSSTLVGLLNSLAYFTKKPIDKESIAKKSCEIEINKIKSPIGKQDQYFAVHGGFCYFQFNQDESVNIEKFSVSDKIIQEIQDNMICFYTGIPRDASTILTKQKEGVEKNRNILNKIRNLADDARDSLKNKDLTKFGEMLNKGWELKKRLSDNVSNDIIDSYYKKAIKEGAIGGKINGAGGGGFITFYCEKKNQEKVKKTLNLKELNFKMEDEGTKLVFNS